MCGSEQSKQADNTFYGSFSIKAQEFDFSTNESRVESAQFRKSVIDLISDSKSENKLYDSGFRFFNQISPIFQGQKIQIEDYQEKWREFSINPLPQYHPSTKNDPKSKKKILKIFFSKQNNSEFSS